MSSTFYRRSLAAAACSGVVAAFACSAGAGPLNPPAGAIAGTGKTTQEIFDKVAKVEPRTAVNAVNTPASAYGTFTITTPGSYYLEANVAPSGNSTVIAIGCSNVTLDLNGFTVNGGGAQSIGVRVYAGGQQNITIVNGHVSGCMFTGIDMQGVLTPAVTVRNVKLIANGNGLLGGHGVSVIDCTAEGNAQAGFRLLDNATITGCQARGNQGVGFWAVDHARVSSCQATANGGEGFIVQTGALVESCLANGNSGAGFATYNAQLVSGCVATGNVGGGILAYTGTTVEGCSVLGNQRFGISAINQCMVKGNNCANNTAVAGPGGASGAGIIVTGQRNRVEGNTCTGNVRGVEVTETLNWIGRNTAGSNSLFNYSIVASNYPAPIVVTPANGGAITGNTYTPAGATATDPNTNYSF